MKDEISEEVYTLLTDFQKLSDADRILSNIVPGCSTIIPDKEFKDIRRKINIWMMKHLKKLRTE
ncbi:MAG: hypothetical protein GY834_10760 [Bacteroidetes bacterium]|nr:hypothetical protein [Bacteroidota bacterium]